MFDKTDPSDPERREEFWSTKLRTLALLKYWGVIHLLYIFFVLRHFSKVAVIYRVKMSVIVGKLLDRGGIAKLNLVIRFIFVYTRENSCLKCSCWSVKKYEHCRLIWKLCIVCEAVLKKAIAETLTEMVFLFMITLIWK